MDGAGRCFYSESPLSPHYAEMEMRCGEVKARDLSRSESVDQGIKMMLGPSAWEDAQ